MASRSASVNTIGMHTTTMSAKELANYRRQQRRTAIFLTDRALQTSTSEEGAKEIVRDLLDMLGLRGEGGIQ